MKKPQGAFAFASVALAAAGGHLSLDVFARYLASLRPKAKRRKQRRKP